MQRKKNNIKEIIGLENYYRLISLPFDSNPVNPTDIKTEIKFDKLSLSLQNIIMKLPLVKFTGRFDDGGLNKDKQFYLMTTLKQYFLVDTQGSNYARYVSKIVSLPDVSNKSIEKTFRSTEYIKVLKRSEQFEITFENIKYILEITEENNEAFISIEYNGNYVMDKELESNIIKFFNNYKI